MPALFKLKPEPEGETVPEYVKPPAPPAPSATLVDGNETVTSPVGSELQEMVGGAVTTIEQVEDDADPPILSVTVTVKLIVPVFDGVPEIVFPLTLSTEVPEMVNT